jgi:hypothetical protein
MPKRVFWPVALVVLGIIALATSVGMMPASFWNLWPLILIIVGLGGLLISDKEEWDTAPTPRRAVAKPPVKKAAPKVAAKAASRRPAPKLKKRK